MLQHWLDFGRLAAGVLILTAGLIQLSFSHPFRPDRNRALAVLGIAGILYGARLLADLAAPGSPPGPLHELIPASKRFLNYFDVYITYVILVPVLYFFELTFGAGRYQSVRWTRRVVAAYALPAIAIDTLTGIPRAAQGPNRFMSIGMIAVLVWNSFRGARGPGDLREVAADSAGLRVARIGLYAFGAFVLFENIINHRLLHDRVNIEWLGVLVLLGCLGYVALSRAVDTDRRLQELKHELETARQIQASILPRQMPAVDGVAIAARYLPMAAVAGDFYDFLELGPGRVGVFIADVSGHGVPAALIASMVKVALAAQSAHADDPARVLAGMNQVFCGRLERQFITAAYACVDTRNGWLRYGAAGHPPALLIHPRGEVDEITENGVMLGHFPDWAYTWAERPFQPGDRLVLYTDGLVEATNARGDFFDLERLRAFAGDGHGRTGENTGAFADLLIGEVGRWSGRQGARGFDDDVTVVVVDRLPAPSSPGA